VGVSLETAKQLSQCIDQIWEGHYFVEDSEGKKVFRPFSDDPKPIEDYEFNWIRNLLSSFETVFNEEMREAATYFVPRRGIYWTPGLVNAADESFPEELRNQIPDKTREDWRAAGRCLAFNLLSASGFHFARAVEGTIEAYYQIFADKPGETLKMA
jgi:hypothetical protein